MARAAGVQAIIDRQFPSGTHPYRIFEQTILDYLDRSQTVLDIGCGRRAPNLIRLRGRARVLIGLDVVEFAIREPDLLLRTGSVCQMSGIETNSIDLAYSRSVMEHIEDAERAFSEICRVLRPAGRYIFLTPNFWDYASLIAYAWCRTASMPRLCGGLKEDRRRTPSRHTIVQTHITASSAWPSGMV
jgi:SAM-dependent methyltransferase